MAGPTMHIEHHVAYLYLIIMPYLLQYLFQNAYPMDPMFRKTMYRVFIRESPWRWPLKGRTTHSIPKCLCGKKKLSARF